MIPAITLDPVPMECMANALQKIKMQRFLYLLLCMIPRTTNSNGRPKQISFCIRSIFLKKKP